MSSSEIIAQQFISGGVIPNQMTGQNAVSKTYVDAQFAQRDAKDAAQDIDIASKTLVDGMVTTPKIANLAVTEPKIADGAIVTRHMSPELQRVGDVAGINAKFNLVDEQLADIATNPNEFGAIGNGTNNDRLFIQQAIDNTPAGGTLLLPPRVNGYYLKNDSPSDTELLLITKPINLKGYGFYSRLVIDDTVPSTCDVMRISPNMGWGGEMYSVEGICVTSKTNDTKPARHALNLDITNIGQNLSRMSIKRNEFYSLGGWSVHLTNPVNTDGFFCSQIEGNRFSGGIYLERGGDSLTISNNTITGYNGIYASLVSGSKELIIMNNNITGRGGILVKKGNSTKILYNNIEVLYADMALANNAMVDIDGSDESTRMYSVDIVGNDITYGAGATVPVNAIRINNVRSAIVDRNFISNNAGQIIVITSLAENTHIGYNLYSCPYPDGTGFITDSGLNTVRTMVHKANPSTGKNDVWQNVAPALNNEATTISNLFETHNMEGRSTSTGGIHRYIYHESVSSSLKHSIRTVRRKVTGGLDLEVDIAYIDNEKINFPQIGFGLIGNDGTKGKIQSRNAAPTTGTYITRDVVFNLAPTLVKNISHWSCITGGTPGVWTAHGCGTGTTANRPTLTANDQGYMYRDTTTGTFVFWNGTAWI